MTDLDTTDLGRADLDWHQARAALEWQWDIGVRDVILDAPINRYDLPDKLPKPASPATPVQGGAKSPLPLAAPPAELDVVGIAAQAAAAAQDLAQLQAALAAFPHCELQRGAKSVVFSDGVPGARVMIVGEAPGRDEDIQGKPFVGRAGQLLDKMLAAIGLDRARDVYITNILPYRPPQNRDPKPEEVAMMMPFVRRHIALAAPDVLICMGNHSCQAILGKRGITKLRGQWDQALDKPVLPMLHPAYLLRQPQAKRSAWADLLELKAWLESPLPTT